MWPLLLCVQVILAISSLTDSAPPLMTVLDEDASSIPDCQEEGLETCVKVNVNFDAFFNNSTITFTTGVLITRGLRVEGTAGSYSYTYEAKDMAGSGTIILTYTRTDDYDTLDGTIDLGPGSFYTLENCGPDCHVLGKESNKKQFPSGQDTKEYIPAASRHSVVSRSLDPEMARLLDLGRQDGVAVISVELYYTPEFAKVTSNIASFMNNEISKVNAAFQQSQIGARLEIHCTKEIDVPEYHSSFHRLHNFRKYYTPTSKLLNTADMAVLFTATNVKDIICGEALSDVGLIKGYPLVAWLAKNCGVNMLAHEVGHLFGAGHDRDTNGPNEYFPFAKGFKVNGGYYTIMTYWSPTHQTGINYFSNVKVTYKGEALGDTNNNNAGIMQLLRYVFANQGDESNKCDGSPVDSTATTCLEIVDSTALCCDWFLGGFCSSSEHQPFMRLNCYNTCRYCSCEDVASRSKCSIWVAQGYCADHTHGNYMKCNCARSCGYCQ